MSAGHVRRAYLKEWAKGKQGANHEYQTVCAQAVAIHFGAHRCVRYLHNVSDVVKAVRKSGWTVRSRKSYIKKGSSVGSVRKQLKKLGHGSYIVRVEGHVLLMNHEGKTVVDTDPRKRDRRKITHLYKVEW